MQKTFSKLNHVEHHCCLSGCFHPLRGPRVRCDVLWISPLQLPKYIDKSFVAKHPFHSNVQILLTCINSFWLIGKYPTLLKKGIVQNLFLVLKLVSVFFGLYNSQNSPLFSFFLDNVTISYHFKQACNGILPEINNE